MHDIQLMLRRSIIIYENNTCSSGIPLLRKILYINREFTE